MKKIWLSVLSLVLVLAVVGLSGCSPGRTVVGEIAGINISSQQTGILVTGQGKVTAVPDIVNLRLGIEAQEVSVAEAQAKAAEAMDRVMAALTDKGVAKKDIQTQYFSIRRVTKWDRVKEEEVVVGYRVTNMVTAKIRDIEKAGSIIDAVANAGGDLTRIESIGFSVDDPSAKAKAKQLAELGGVTLGKPTYISEGISYPVYPREYMYEMAASAAAPVPETPISPGEMEISLTVQVVYAILD